MKRRWATLGSDPPRNSGARRVDATCSSEALVTSPLLAMPGLHRLRFLRVSSGRSSGRDLGPCRDRDAAAPWQRLASSARLFTQPEPVLGALGPARVFMCGGAVALRAQCRDFVLMELDSLQVAGLDNRSRRKMPVPACPWRRHCCGMQVHWPCDDWGLIQQSSLLLTTHQRDGGKARLPAYRRSGRVCIVRYIIPCTHR